jgi:MFS family permease
VSALDHLKPPVPLERRELRVLALLAIVAFTQGWTGTVITHTLAFTRVTFGLSDAEISDVMAITRAVALSALVLSWWGDRHGRRGPLLLAFGILPSANLASAFAPTMLGFAAIQSIARIGTIAVGALALVVLAEEVAPAVRSYASGLYAMAVSSGTGFGLLASSFAESSPEAWRWLFAASSLPLLALPLLARHLAESRAFVRSDLRPPLATALRGGHARYFWPMAGLSFALASFSGPAANFILVRLVNDLGWTQGPAALMLAVVSTPAVVFGLLVGGRTADLAGRRPTQAVSIVIGITGALLFYFSESSYALGLGIFLSVLGASAFGPAFASQRAELFPTGVRATATAWLTNAAIIGGLFGFLAGRFVIDAWGVPVTIASLSGVLGVASLLILTLPETRGTSLTEPVDPLESPGAMPA